ncbi:TnsD family Tn7-like transposition protein [Pseudomonas viridiflava]
MGQRQVGSRVNSVSAITDKGTKALRACSPATYAWLYRNDRRWLQTQVAMQKVVRVRNSTLYDWDARDLRLKELVEASVRQAYAVGPQDSRLSRSSLFALVPTLASCLENYSRYSCTRAYVSALLDVEPRCWR